MGQVHLFLFIRNRYNTIFEKSALWHTSGDPTWVSTTPARRSSRARALRLAQVSSAARAVGNTWQNS